MFVNLPTFKEISADITDMGIPTRYYLDKDTLTFKPIDNSLKSLFKRSYRYIIIISLISVGLFVALAFYGITPHELFLSEMNQNLAVKIVDNNTSINQLRNELSVIQENDDVIYRPFVDIKLIPKAVREAGSGGTDQYRQFAGIENADGVITAFKNIDKLQSQIKVQNNSFEDIEQMVTYIDGYYASKPAVRPILRRDNLFISSKFGNRFHPVHKRYILHSGIDYATSLGTPVYATGNGVVKAAMYASGYGKVVRVNHGYGYESIYAHLSKYIVHKGDTVSRGQLIGYTGNTGVSTGPHLHYEVRKNNRPQNPLFFYIDDLEDEEYLEMVKK